MGALDFVRFWGLVAGKETLRIINHRQTVDVLPQSRKWLKKYF